MFRSWLAVLGLCLAPAAVFAAADPNILATVTAVPADVTLRRPAGTDGVALNTLAAYRVVMTNGATNTLNRVFFSATARNVGSSEALVIDSTVPATLPCTGLGTASARCELGSLPASGGSVDFFVVVRAPLTGQRIDLAWTAGGDEGKGQGSGCCNQTGVTSTNLVDPTTDTSYRLKLTSFVKPQGGTFFTGDAALATEADKWTVRVVVPAFVAQTQTTASIVETPQDTSCASYVLPGGCFFTDLNIPGQFASLKITFLLDSKSYNLSQPETAKLQYTGSNTNIIYPIILGLCSADAVTYAPLPAPSLGRPCLTELPKKLSTKDGVPKALVGDLRFLVEALDNGRFGIQ